jgi:hypothetical protein
MKVMELPEQEKYYRLITIVSRQDYYIINGETKEKIMSAKTDFIMLPNGSVVNKRHIVEIMFDKSLTKEKWLQKQNLLTK